MERSRSEFRPTRISGLLTLLLISPFLIGPIDVAARGGTSGPAPAPGGEPIAVVDANGNQVGEVVGATTNTATVALKVGGRGVILVVRGATTQSSLEGDLLPFQGTGTLRFESTDCSGPPLMFVDPIRTVDPGIVAAPGMTLYMPEVPTILGSRILGSGRGQGGRCVALSPPILADNMVPAVPIIDLLTVFTPPFRIVFR